MPVEVSIANHSRGLLAGDSAVISERERETCLPHRNRNSHCPRRGGVNMPCYYNTSYHSFLKIPLSYERGKEKQPSIVCIDTYTHILLEVE